MPGDADRLASMWRYWEQDEDEEVAPAPEDEELHPDYKLVQ